jgi:hypothetical protein
MPTDIEQSYLDQGYSLPEGLTWEIVADRRTRWNIRDIFVPVAVAPGCLAWGVCRTSTARRSSIRDAR